MSGTRMASAGRALPPASTTSRARSGAASPQAVSRTQQLGSSGQTAQMLMSAQGG
jgi:hypothetical protein